MGGENLAHKTEPQKIPEHDGTGRLVLEESNALQIDEEARHHIWELMHQMKMGLEEKDAPKLGKLASRIRKEFGIDLDTARKIYREETKKLIPERKPSINKKTTVEDPQAKKQAVEEISQTIQDIPETKMPLITEERKLEGTADNSKKPMAIFPTMQSDITNYQPKENWFARRSRKTEEARQKKADAKYEAMTKKIEDYEPEEDSERIALQNKLQEELQYLKDVYGIKMDMDGQMGFFSRRKWKRMVNGNDSEFHKVTDVITKMQTELANLVTPAGTEKQPERKIVTPKLGEVKTTPDEDWKLESESELKKAEDKAKQEEIGDFSALELKADDVPQAAPEEEKAA